MQIAQINSKQNPTFKNGFFNVTRELDSSVMLSRALIDLCGCDIPWVIMANNNTERKEKSRKLFSAFTIAWLTPFVTLPFSNRFAMKHIGKLTKNFWSNNHKAIHISNEFLKDTKSMMPELRRMAAKTDKSPIESVFNKFYPKKKYEQKLNLDELLESVNGDEEKLRKKLIRSKNAVFIADCLFTFTAIGAFPFLNNEITKKGSGQSGFSAEMSMADKKIVENRARNYEKTKRRKFLAYMGILTGTTLAMSLCAFASLYSKNGSKLTQKIKSCSKLFDYNKGIYMSRLPLFIGSLVTCLGAVLAARNNTERKDVAARFGIPLTVFYGGDLLLSSLFSNLSDRIFCTKLRKSCICLFGTAHHHQDCAKTLCINGMVEKRVFLYTNFSVELLLFFILNKKEFYNGKLIFGKCMQSVS